MREEPQSGRDEVYDEPRLRRLQHPSRGQSSGLGGREKRGSLAVNRPYLARS